MRENNNIIDSSEITVIIQGLTHFEEGNFDSPFYKCVDSIKKFLPKAEIIVSTWKGQVCNDNRVDFVIFNDEPETIFNFMHQPWNFNKMVISTKNGLEKATRRYALKFRADLHLTGKEFFIVPNTSVFHKKFYNYKILKQPVIISNIFVRDPASHIPLLFHVSDIVQFGLTQDLLDIWNREAITAQQILIPLKWWSGFYYPGYAGIKMVPEQALMIGWLQSKGFSIHLPFPAYISKSYSQLSEIMLSANFYVIDWRHSGINFPERFFTLRKFTDTIYDPNLINNIINIYNNKVYSCLRFMSILWYSNILKLFRWRFWVDFVATILLWASPKLFFYTRQAWRKLLKIF